MSRVGGSPEYLPWTSTTRPHDLVITYCLVDSLSPYAKNTRKRSDAQVA